MRKKILFADLGDVIIKFEEKHMRDLIKEEFFPCFLELVHEHDRGNLEAFDLHRKLVFENYYKNPVPWKKFSKIYWRCINSIHVPMLEALENLKKRGVALACLTDNNHFCFYATSVKFPRICDLFYDNGKEMWMLSYKFGSLKRDMGLFTRLPSEFGYPLEEAAFVDNLQLNIETAVKAGFAENSCFLYDRFDPENHLRFIKFLEEQFS